VTVGDQRSCYTDETTPQEPRSGVNDFSSRLVHENGSYVQQNQPGVILPNRRKGSRPLDSFTPGPVPCPGSCRPGTACEVPGKV
jgi:hypothetical protein